MADARLQVTIDAVDHASAQIRSVEQNLSRIGTEARRVGLTLGLFGGAVLGAMALAVKSTEDGKKALEELGETTGKLKETVGQALVPVLLALNDALKPMVDRVIEFVKEHPRVVQAIALIAGAMVALGVALFLGGTALRASVQAWELFGSVLKGAIWIVNAMTGSQIALSAATARAVAVQIAQILLLAGVFLVAEAAGNKFFKWIHAIPQETKPLWEQLADKVGDVGKTIMEKVIPATAKFGEESKIATGKAIDGVQAEMDKIRELHNALGVAAHDQAEAAARATVDKLAPTVELFKQLSQIAGPQLDAAIAKFIAGGLSANEAWKVATLQVRDAITATMEELAKGSPEMQAILAAWRAGLLSIVDAYNAIIAAQAAAMGGLTVEGGAAASPQAVLDAWNALSQADRDARTAKANEPHLASGGIVTRPTRALIGEAGPEAVIPLVSNKGGGLGMFNIYLQLDGRTIASILGGQAGVGEQVRSS